MTRMTPSEAFVEVMATQDLGEPFRRDALKKPVRLLEKYKDYTVT